MSAVLCHVTNLKVLGESRGDDRHVDHAVLSLADLAGEVGVAYLLQGVVSRGTARTISRFHEQEIGHS